MNPLLLIVEVFRWTTVPWFFPYRVFHVKILVLILCDYLHYIWSLFDSVFTAQRGKRIGTCIPLY